jgi:hypothetical protein
MTKIFRVSDEDGSGQRFFADRFSALEHAKAEHQSSGEQIEVEMITLVKLQPSMLAVALLEGGYCAEAKTIKVHKRRKKK